MGQIFRGILLAGTSAWLIGFGNSALAQNDNGVRGARDKTEEGTQNQNEIIVTALRRTQPLQDVPAAVTSINGDELRGRGANSFQSYLNAVPSVYFADNGRRTRVSIRGVVSDVGGDPPVGATTAIYIDEAPVTELEASAFDPSLDDVQSVEVLRGPQGTLYGSGSMGGTVRVTLNKPDLSRFTGELAGHLGTMKESDGTVAKASGIVNLPVMTDRIGFRASLGYEHTPGFIDNSLSGAEDINATNRLSGRAALLIAAGPGTSIYANFLYQRDRFKGLSFADQGGFTIARPTEEPGYSNAKLFSVTINHDAGWMNLVSATNYLKKRSEENLDGSFFVPLINFLGGLNLPADQGLSFTGEIPYDIFTQEIRLASSGENKLDWLVGGYFAESDATFRQYINTAGVPGLAALGNAGVYSSLLKTHRRQFAGFGELTYNILPNLSLTGGVRVAYLESSIERSASGLLNGGVTGDSSSGSNTAVTKKFLLNYAATPDNLLYAQASQGFREGSGVAPVPYSACASDLADYGLNQSPTQYDPDKLWSYEIGSKNTFFDRKMTLNVAAYYIDWNKRQQTVNLNTCQFSTILNVGKAVSKGFEIELGLRPTSSLSLNGSISYTNSKITEFDQLPQFVDSALPLQADWQGFVSAQQDFVISSSMDGYVRMDGNYVGKRWNLLRGSSAAAEKLDSYFLMNTRVGVVVNSNLDISLFVNNLTDVRIVPNRNSQGEDFLAEPRVIAVAARYKF